MALWGFWLKEETPGTARLLSAPRKDRGLGQASEMTVSRCSELSDPVAAASYSARSRPTRNKCAFPRGRPPPSHNPAGRAAPVPGSEFTETPPPPPPRGTQTQPPFPCAPCPLWVDLPLQSGQLASDLPDSSRVGPRGGSPPRSRWRTSSDDAELKLRP